MTDAPIFCLVLFALTVWMAATAGWGIFDLMRDAARRDGWVSVLVGPALGAALVIILLFET